MKNLLLTSENGHAIKDFYHCIEHNNLILDNDFINVSVQGIDCPKSICKILDSYECSFDGLIHPIHKKGKVKGYIII